MTDAPADYDRELKIFNDNLRAEYRASQHLLKCSEEEYLASRTVDLLHNGVVLEFGRPEPAASAQDAVADLGPATPRDEEFRAEYRQNAAAFMDAGIAEAAYVRSRRIDEGLEPLLPPCPR